MNRNKANSWSKEADQALLNLLKIYGDHRWADIARQLKEIYNYDYTPNVILHRWNRLNPLSYKKPWNHEEDLQFFDQIKKHGNNWTLIQIEMSQRNNNQLRARLYSIFRRTFRKLNLTIGKMKNVNQGRIKNIKPAVFIKMLTLTHQPDSEIKEEDLKDDLYLNVIKSCKKLLLLIEVVFKSENWNNKALVYEQLLKITDRDEVQVMFEHLFLLNTMHQVEHSMILPQEKYICQQTIQIREHSLMNRRKKMCGVRTWEEADALNEPYAMHSETDEEEQDYIKQPKDSDIIQKFNQQEIQLLKESTLYKKLFQNERREFLDLYNNSLQSNKENTILLNYQDETLFDGVKQEAEIKQLELPQNDQQVKKHYTRSCAKQESQIDDNKRHNKLDQKKIRNPKKRSIKRQSLTTKTDSNILQKIEVSSRRAKISKMTFRDRYTMFRDEDYIKQEQDEPDQEIKQMSEVIKNDTFQDLFNDLTKQNFKQKQITNSVQFALEDEFNVLFDL